MDLLEDVGGELDVVDAIAAVEDHGVDGRAVGDTEWIGGVPAGRDGGGADDAGSAEVGRECCAGT